MREYQVVTAQPDFFVLVPVYDMKDDLIEFMKEPVIAWAIEISSSGIRNENFPLIFTRPITMNGYDEGEHSDMILRPNGTVSFCCDTDFDDYDSAFNEFKARHESKKKLNT